MKQLRGRFDKEVDPDMEQFASSIEVDLKMVEEDIEGSKAHAQMLGEVGLLSSDEVDAIVEGLGMVQVEIRDGVFQPSTEFEDIHMAVEARLEKHIGAVAGKLHTARSRNDQVATDLRLWLKTHLARLDQSLEALLRSLLGRIETDGQVLMPGYTHLQRGQPIFLGHHLLGHAWPIARDRERLKSALRRVDLCPLGAGALAGTAHPIDRHQVAEKLGFGGVVENAIDAVAARDHLQETASVCAIAMANLSRMAADIILWSTQEFRFLRLDEAFSTGSSIMPQKRNPDAAELIRGKTGRVFGDLVGLLTLTKGLPLAYNRDLQEDREAIFDAVLTTSRCASILSRLWSSVEVDQKRFDDELRDDPILATELADALVDGGVPFREAHGVVARLILHLEGEGRGIESLTHDELSALHPSFPPDTLARLDPRQAADRRTSYGGTAWSEIERQKQLLLELLDG